MILPRNGCSQQVATSLLLLRWTVTRFTSRIGGGNLFAVKRDSGRLIWSHKISDYDGVDGAISRVSPAVDGNQIIIGDILNGKQVHNGANVISVDRESGTLRWMTKVDNHAAAIITGSPVVFDGVCLCWSLFERRRSGN